jgi:hypothetical protein
VPQLPPREESRLTREAQTRIEGAERVVRQIDQARLAPAQQEIYATIQSFLAKAREAMSARDYPRALTLADKARILADDLSRAPR